MYAALRPQDYAKDTDPFYIAVNTQLCHADVTPAEHHKWFKRQPIGTNKLSRLMADMTEKAGLDRRTNHSARKHLVQKLNDSNVPPHQIIQITGHKNINSINNYSNLSLAQQKTISHIVSNPVRPTSLPAPEPAAIMPSSSAEHMPSSSAGHKSTTGQHNRLISLPSSSTAHMSTIEQNPLASLPSDLPMFTNCKMNIGTLNINVNYKTVHQNKRRRINVIDSQSSQESQ
jgi:hypothetical protein